VIPIVKSPSTIMAQEEQNDEDNDKEGSEVKVQMNEGKTSVESQGVLASKNSGE